MMRWVSWAQLVRNGRLGMPGVAACLLGLGCGSADSGKTLFEEMAPVAPEPTVTTLPPEADVPPEMMPSMPDDGTDDGTDDGQTTVPDDTNPEPSTDTNTTPDDGAPRPCRPANGVSGSPTTISQAIILLNTLPKPVSLECFLQALDRPLTVYATKSDDSLQPSPGARSPRTFILRGELEMSIVLEGNASNTLEFGFRPDISRSIKTEIVFPLTKDLSESNIFDAVQQTDAYTRCGACHIGEAKETFPDFPLGAFVSDVIAPFDMDEVSLDEMRAERAACDANAEPYRCGLLGALFDHGDVVPGVLRGRE